MSRVLRLNDPEDPRQFEGLSSPEEDKSFLEAPLGGNIEELPDGSAVLHDEVPPTKKQGSFGDNLALSMEPSALSSLASELLMLVERDKKSRSRRDELYAEGLRRTGLGEEAPGGAEFEGASRVVHPVLTEAAIDFEARAIKELFPAGGPVKTQLLGEKDQKRQQVAELKRNGLNWLFTKGIREYRSELEQTLSQVPMGGSQFMKVRPDLLAKRIRIEFVPIDDMFIAYSASSFYTSPRNTHRQWVTEFEFQRRIASKLYREIQLDDSPSTDNISNAQEASDKIEGRALSPYNDDGLREVYELDLYYQLDDDPQADGLAAPYIIHLDEHSETVLGIYRNWRENDPAMEKKQWIVEWGMIPWRGAYKLGLTHLIGSLSAGATGALRALLDSAHVSNAPTLLKLGKGRISGQTTTLELTQVQEVEGVPGVDDIRNLVMSVPFAGPSSVLFQLLGFLVDGAKGVVTTAEEKIADASNQMPVGTTLALIEQGSKVFAAIHARLHESQARVIEIVCRLLSEYPQLLEPMQEALGDKAPPAEVFGNTDDIAPVSDPNIFSEAQRFAQTQALLQMQSGDAQDQSIPWNKLEIRRRALQQMNIQDVDNILPLPKPPQPNNPVAENVTVTHGGAIIAGLQQDHTAHIYAHLTFLENPLLCLNPIAISQVGPPLLEHIRQHLYMEYAEMMQGAPDDVSMAKYSEKVNQAIQATYADVPQRLQPILQLIQKTQPAQPMDPAQASLQAAMAETERRAAADRMAHDAALAKVESDDRRNQETIQQREADAVRTLQSAMEQQKDSLMIEIARLNQGQQEIQLLAEKQTMEINQQFHDMLARLAERTEPQVTQTEAAGFDPTPHLDRIQQMMEQQRNDQHGQAMSAALQGIQQLLQQGTQRPNKVIRDKNGDAMGMVYDPTFGQTVQ